METTPFSLQGYGSQIGHGGTTFDKGFSSNMSRQNRDFQRYSSKLDVAGGLHQ